MGVRVAPSGEQWTIASAGHEAVVVEVGGGLRSYAVDGVPVVDGYGEDQLSPANAGQILAPWPNRIRDGRYTFAGTARQLPLTEPDTAQRHPRPGELEPLAGHRLRPGACHGRVRTAAAAGVPVGVGAADDLAARTGRPARRAYGHECRRDRLPVRVRRASVSRPA